MMKGPGLDIRLSDGITEAENTFEGKQLFNDNHYSPPGKIIVAVQATVVHAPAEASMQIYPRQLLAV